MQLSSSLQVKDLEYKPTRKLNNELPKSLVLEPGFAKLQQIPTNLTKNQMKKRAREERNKSKGGGWFNMPAQELTEEKKNDLMVIKMRSVLDPKRFYKQDELKGKLPSFFQIGTVVESRADFYSSRIPKKMRKKTLVEELLQDAEFRKYNKKKYAQAVYSENSKKRNQRYKGSKSKMKKKQLKDS